MPHRVHAFPFGINSALSMLSRMMPAAKLVLTPFNEYQYSSLHSATMKRFRTRDILANTGKGPFWGSQRPISRDSNVHTVWPGDGQSVKFWANCKIPNSRYPSKAHISRLECPTSSNFPHSCMAGRRTIGEILGRGSELEISLQTQERGHFGGHKGPYLETRMFNFLQTFHTVVWPGDG